MSKTNDETRISIQGMHCMGCVGRVERALNSSHGVSGARVNLAKGEAIIEYDSSQIDLEGLKEVIKGTGYAAQIIG
jgi:copper chaperone CopZ